jgi:UDP-2,3-diacylglucosamine pyrophosphatase LpxH
MITSVKSEKMVVISDLHLGNPFSGQHRQVIHFLKWAAENGYDLCINGDGLEIAQSSFTKMVQQVPEFLRSLGELKKRGQEVYYVTGNHDIVLEHFLEDWGLFKVSPFLNVTSEKARVHIEHGHLYDPLFIKNPSLYEVLTHLGGWILKLNPNFYRLWMRFEKWRSQVRARKLGIVGEHPNFRLAAEEISRRGFDFIIFGHTHHPGEIQLQSGAIYFNPGSWLMSTHFVEIKKGSVQLKLIEHLNSKD